MQRLSRRSGLRRRRYPNEPLDSAPLLRGLAYGLVFVLPFWMLVVMLLL
jgi:hypothetical protein